MSSNQPLITIGITCFNAEDTVSRAIKSAINQNYSNFEIVIVDDFSTDNSVDVVEASIKNQENIKFIQHRKNKGPAGTRQTIIDNAKGEFIAFFDDDDEALPERIRTQHERINEYKIETGENLIACYSSGTRIYPNGYKKDLIAIGSKPPAPKGTSVADRALFFGGNNKQFFAGGTPSCSLMASKKTFEKVGGFDDSFRRVEDIDFAIRLSIKGGHFIGCQEKLFIQYATEANDKAPEKNLEAEQKLAKKYVEYLQKKGMYYYALNWPLIRFYHFKKNYIKMIWVLLKIFVRYPIKTTSHFLTTAPKRLIHERKMNR